MIIKEVNDSANKESSDGFSSSVNQRDDTKIAPSIDDEKASTKSVVDHSIPSAVIEVGNSSDMELIPSDVDEIDDSLEVNLIPPFLFVEEEDVDSLNDVSLRVKDVSKSLINDFFRLNQLKIGEEDNCTRRNCVQFFSENQ
ncbi:uncharacterized protein LOC113357009 [Papaver somniferum]|uniref:uncharacterized protein LOC113357009 n=1 Tax=Papaver somniferum TaxID=3469 RepID=UPI000E7004C4|nr:uncharacterized protein LOC113357009 [Papaver somniferum]